MQLSTNDIKNKTVVLALGGNALGDTPASQKELIKDTAKAIVKLVENNNRLIITHGNGPQVGMINLAFEEAYKLRSIKSDMPFPECGAMSQGYIGFHLQNALYNEFNSMGIDKSAVSIITQIVVDKNDKAFDNPTKPIGAFYSKEEAEKLMAAKNIIMKEDSGRGFRQLIASPLPLEIVELSSIKALLDKGFVVICNGGGGVPVYREDGKLLSIPAVIDKDFAAARLAMDINADILMVLTAVDRVCINYNTEQETKLESVSISQMEEYISQGHFAPGSMLPKVQACINASKAGIVSIISSLKSIEDTIEGRSGTKIIKE